MLMNDLIELKLRSHHAIWNLSQRGEFPTMYMQIRLILLDTVSKRGIN